MLVDVIERTRMPDDRWTCYWRAKGRVQQIDYILASAALAARVKQSHITRTGLGYRELNARDEILPKEITLTHFEADVATPRPPSATPNRKQPFRFERYEPIRQAVENNVSDHCPVNVWF